MEEMEWSTYQRQIRDPNNPLQTQRGEWAGEWQCTARSCTTQHIAPPEPTGVPTLWSRRVPPETVLPWCTCAATTLRPALLHDPNAPEQPWSSRWFCVRCGLWDARVRGVPRSAPALELAAELLDDEQWTSICNSGDRFWASVQEAAARAVRQFVLQPNASNYAEARPPTNLTEETNSRIFVPLLLDAAGLLNSQASRAWRQHELASVEWDRWCQRLRTVPAVSISALAAALQTELDRHPHTCRSNHSVRLLWHSAASGRGDGSGAETNLHEIVSNSLLANSYIPGLAQEVLLLQFGGPDLCHAVLQLAEGLRSAQDATAVTISEVNAQGGPIATTAQGEAPTTIGGFVRGANLITGHGWNQAAAADSELCDMPSAARDVAPEQNTVSHVAAASTESTADGATGQSSNEPEPSVLAPQAQPASHYSVVDERNPGPSRAAEETSERVDAEMGAPMGNPDGNGGTSSGLTQDMALMTMSDGGDAGPRGSHEQPAAAARQQSRSPRRAGESSRRSLRARAPPARPPQLLSCLWCTAERPFTATTSGGLMSHITWRHSGAALEQRHVSQLVTLGKGCCEECGSLRASQSRQCGWCGCQTRCRQPRVGDVVVGRTTARVDTDGRPSAAPSNALRPAAGEVVHIPVEPWSSDDAWLAASAQAGDIAGSGQPESGDGHQSNPAPQQRRQLQAPMRALNLPQDLDGACAGLTRNSVENVPESLIPRFALAWAECLEGMAAGDPTWSSLAKWRTRLLACHIPFERDRVAEMRERLRLWESGDISSLTVRVQGCRIGITETASRRVPQSMQHGHAGKKAKYKARRNAYRKAIMQFNGKLAEPTAAEKVEWANTYVPRSDRQSALSNEPDVIRAQANAQHQGDAGRARRQLLQQADDGDGTPRMPWIKFPGLTAPGETGDRPEHLADCMSCRHAASKRRLNRALDELSVQMSLGTLAPCTRWMLDTSLVWHRKAAIDTDDDEDAWIQQLSESQWDPDIGMDDIPEEEIVLEPPGHPHEATPIPMDTDSAAAAQEDSHMEEASPRPKVRPIQMGEFLRKFLVRRTLHVHRLRTQRTMLSCRQWGVGAPGGSEAIAHCHLGLESLHRAGKLPTALLAVQVDAENFFGSLEWDAIRQAVGEELPELGPTTAWKHQAPSYAHQEGAPPQMKNRGAEQGDAAAAAETGATLSCLSRSARWDVHAEQASGALPCPPPLVADEDPQTFRQRYDTERQRISLWENSSPAQRGQMQDRPEVHPGNAICRRGGVADLWFMDDGTIVMHPNLGVAYLRLLDRRIEEAGGKRNIAKSNAILYASEQHRRDHEAEWNLAELRTLCSLHTPDDALPTLGASLGGPTAQVELFRRRTQVVTAMHRRLPEIGDAAVEHVLGRSCLGVAKTTHVLRLHGLTLWEERLALEEFDAVQSSAMERLFPGQDAASLRQASLGISVGGMGHRRAVDVALPAALASLTMARPKVASFDKDLAAAGLITEGLLLQQIDDNIAAASQALRASLDGSESAQIPELLSAAAPRAEEVWTASIVGSVPEADVTTPMVRWDPLALDEAGAPAPYQQSGLDTDLLPAPQVRRAINVSHLQKCFSMLMDNTRLRTHLVELSNQDRHTDMRRLQELRHKDVDHSWTDLINPRTGSVLLQDEYITAVQHRLGCSFFTEATRCHLCGEVLDKQAAHASCCARAEATRGHYAVVNVLMNVIRVADPSAATEVAGLATTDPSARPADILTNAAIPGRGAALDVVVASQEAFGAGPDCVATAVKRKIRRYAAILHELHEAGIAFRPMAWSAEGRPHPMVGRVLAHASEQVARKRPSASAHEICRRLRQEIGVALARRMARMIRACTPSERGLAALIVTGQRA